MTKEEFDELQFFASYYDDDFITELETLFEQASKLFKEYKPLSPEDNDKVEEELFSSKGFSADKTLDVSLKAFEKINPVYREYAQNILQNYRLQNSITGDGEESSARVFNFNENPSDPMHLNHELTHKIVSGEDYLLAADSGYKDMGSLEYNPTFLILSEINPIFVELVTASYMGENIDSSGDLLKNDLLFRMSNLESDFFGRAIGKGVSKINNENFIKEIKGKSYFLINDEFKAKYSPNVRVSFDKKMYRYAHNFGTLMACYMYEKVLEDKNNMKMFLGIDYATTMVEEKPEDEFDYTKKDYIKHLREIGLPFIGFKTFYLDEERRNEILNTLKRMLDRVYGKEPMKSIVGDDALITQELMNETSDLFLEDNSQVR